MPKRTSKKIIKVSKSYEDNVYKVAQNRAFVHALQESLCTLGLSLATLNNTSFVCVLDSIERNSCNALMHKGLKRTNILAIESNEQIGKDHVKAGIPTHIGPLFTFAEETEKYTQEENNWHGYACYGGIFDFTGSVEIRGKEMLIALRKMNVVPGAVFSVTFCRARIAADKYIRQRNNFIENLRRVLALKHVTLNSKYDILRYAGNGRGARGAPMEFLLFTTSTC